MKYEGFIYIFYLIKAENSLWEEYSCAKKFILPRSPPYKYCILNMRTLGKLDGVSLSLSKPEFNMFSTSKLSPMGIFYYMKMRVRGRGGGMKLNENVIRKKYCNSRGA